MVIISIISLVVVQELVLQVRGGVLGVEAVRPALAVGRGEVVPRDVAVLLRVEHRVLELLVLVHVCSSKSSSVSSSLSPILPLSLLSAFVDLIFLWPVLTHSSSSWSCHICPRAGLSSKRSHGAQIA